MNYIVAAAKGLYCFFYRDGSMWLCEYKNNMWSEAKEIMQGTERDFTINLVAGEIVIIWRDMGANLNKSKFCDDGTVVTEVLIENAGDVGRYWAVYAEGGMNLIYNMVVAREGVGVLVSQFVGENNTWGAIKHIDKIGSAAGSPFGLVSITGKHFLVLYQKSDFDNSIGYREIYGTEIGRYNQFHSGAGKFGDYSFLATKYDIHGVYVAKGLFGTALTYKKRLEGGFSPGFVVADGQNAHNILLYIIKGELHLAFTRGNDLYGLRLGEDLDRRGPISPERYERPPGRHITKAVFLSEDKNDNFLANELLVNRERPWEIQFLSDYVTGPYRKSTQKERGVSIQAAKPSENDYNSFFDDMEKELRKIKG